MRWENGRHDPKPQSADSLGAQCASSPQLRHLPLPGSLRFHPDHPGPAAGRDALAGGDLAERHRRPRAGLSFPEGVSLDRRGAYRRHLPWGISCLLVVGTLVALNVLVTVGSILAVGKLLQDLPTTPEAQKKVYSNLRDKLENISPVAFDREYLPNRPRIPRSFNTFRGSSTPTNPTSSPSSRRW